MERLTIPDVRVDEHTTRRSMIDVLAVREHAMEVYHRLKAYEDIAELCGGIDRLRELAEADKDGRIRIIPESQNGACGCCWYFEREPGTKHGTCAKRPHPRDRYGKIDHSKQFIVSQSTQSCRLYMSLCSEAERAMEGKPGPENAQERSLCPSARAGTMQTGD